MSVVQSYLLKQIGENKISKADGEIMLKELNIGKKENKNKSIAIIGMAGKFAECNNIDEFWSAITKGKECICDFPSQRIPDIEHILKNKYYMEFMQGDFFSELGDMEKLFRKGGYLNEIDKFDAAFFGISPREAKYMEPMQRFFLEAAYQSIEDAGYGGDMIYGTKTGVFVGRDNTNIPLYRYTTEPDTMHLTGSYGGILASRVSYIFNLKGPAMVIDTACSSALISIHEACQSINNGECEMAIAGGISVFPLGTIKDLKNQMSFESIESKDDKIRTFDRDAKGTVWGEGVGSILLKPLSKALNDGDHIHAVIRGSAINNDGASNGITAPSAAAQEEVILMAWKNAGIDPETIGYVEAHGTGTVLGDPIEIKGLTNAFRKHTDRNQFCAIGSLKPNIGHLVAASGVASLIKVVMSLKNKTLPPSIYFDNPNPYINFAKSPVYVNDTLKNWESGTQPRRAGISSFGFSGTNCHIILEEIQEPQEVEPTEAECIWCLTLSAKSKAALISMIEDYKNSEQLLQSQNIESICYTSNIGRGHYTYRLAIMVRSVQELIAKIKSVDTLETDENQGIFYGQHKVVLESKKSKESGDITDDKKARLTKNAQVLLSELNTVKGEAAVSKLKEICSLYVTGAWVEWKILYNGKKIKKAAIPVYPLERTRCWAEPKNSKLECKEVEKFQMHPLIHGMVTDSIRDQIYETYLTTDCWVLSDHKVMNHCIIPGTSYLEMAREAAYRYYKTNSLELRNVTFLTPLAVEENEKKYVQIILKKEKEFLEFIIASRQDMVDQSIESQWIEHVRGMIYILEEKSSSNLDIDTLISENIQKKYNVNMENQEGIFDFGPRWYSLKEVNFGTNFYVAKVALDEEYMKDLEEYYMHPALLDNAINAALKDNNGDYLPLNYKSFKIYNSMPAVFYSYIRKKDNITGSKETVTYDVTLADEQGRIFAEISDYTIKKVEIKKLKFNELSHKRNTNYEITWVKEQNYDFDQLPNGVVLVFKNMNGFADDMIRKLEDCNRHCIEVELGNSFKKIDENNYMIGSSQEDYNMLIDCIRRENVRLILHMFSFDYESGPENVENLEDTQRKGIYSLFYLNKAVINQKLGNELTIVAISSYACKVVESQKMIYPYNATLMGLGKVVGQENKNLKVRYLDIDSSVTSEKIMKELTCKEAPYAVAYRNQERYVQLLQEIELVENCEDQIDISDGKTYVITGGTGGLGIEVAKYLASKGKVNLGLINRSIFPKKDKWKDILLENSSEKLCSKIKALGEMEDKGCRISCYSADVCKQEDIQDVLADIRAKYGRIHGIIHCAGIAGDGFLMLKEESVFRSVIAPKVTGTWLIDKLTREDNPEFFIMFSSIAAVTGGQGQGDYTAANSFLNSYADYRSNCGLKTVSINWPAWKETGMAVDLNAAVDMMMCKAISTVDAMDYMEEILQSQCIHVIAGELNYDVLSVIKGRNLFRISELINMNLKQKVKRNRQTEGKEKKESQKCQIELQGKGEEEYTNTEKILGLIWGDVLGISSIDIYENFFEMGGDSILSTNLLKSVEEEFPGALEISDIFSYPTVVNMAEYIDSKKKS